MLYESMYDSMSPIIVHYLCMCVNTGGHRIPSVTDEDEDDDGPEQGLYTY